MSEAFTARLAPLFLSILRIMSAALFIAHGTQKLFNFPARPVVDGAAPAAFELFSLLLDMIKTDVTRTLMTVQIRSAEELRAAEEHEALQNVQYQHAAAPDEAAVAEAAETAALPDDQSEALQPFVRGGQKVGRNDPCPCGSGKKYKQCHGKLS